MDMTQLDRG